MKKIRIFATALLLAFTLSSCESFFDVELDDQAKIEDIFRQKTEVQKYLSHLYSYIPQEEEVVGMHGWTVGRSDEALFSWYQWVYYTQFRTGNYSSATTNFNYWPDYYIGINQCSIFLKYIDLDKEDTPTTVAYMKAEARFLRRIRDDACRIFGTTLSPDYNAVHYDHLHLEATDTRFCR